MKKYLPLIILAAVHVGFFAFFYSIVGLVLTIQSFRNVQTGFQNLFNYLLEMFILICALLLTINIYKNKKLAIPVGVLSVYLFLNSANSFVEYVTRRPYYYYDNYIMRQVLYIVGFSMFFFYFVFALVLFICVKPFRKENPYRSYSRPAPTQNNYGQYQQQYPQQGYPQYQQPYPQQYPQQGYPQYQQPTPQPAPQPVQQPEPQPFPQQSQRTILDKDQISEAAAEEIKKAREQLDQGAITIEEYNEIQRKALNK